MKSALVTGGSRGIGRAICLALVKAGYQVVFTYVQNDIEASRTAAMVPVFEGQPQLLPIKIDITNLGQVKALAESLDGLDVLVNNAGINEPASFEDITLESWERVLKTNLTGAFLMSQTLWPKLNKNGAVIFIGSSSAQTGGPVSTHYAAAKAGLEGLMRNLAIYGSPKQITSNLIAPGYIAAGVAEKAITNELVRSYLGRILLGFMGTPEDVAQAVVYLTKARYTTGQVINVNGGLVW